MGVVGARLRRLPRYLRIVKIARYDRLGDADRDLEIGRD
jgi:hypothetical protein